MKMRKMSGSSIKAWITEFFAEGIIYIIVLYILSILTMGILGTGAYLNELIDGIKSMNWNSIFEVVILVFTLGITSVFATHVSSKYFRPILGINRR